MNRTRAYSEYQNEIYLAGLKGTKPRWPVAIEALEALARGRLPSEAYGYIAGGAGSEATMRANLEAFDHWRIVPRMLRDVKDRNLATRVLNTDLSVPVLLAPIGVQTMAHPQGELETARAARRLRVPLIHSTAATKSLEEVAAVLGDCPLWYQLYWPRDRAVTRSFVRRAQKAGCAAIVVTLDTRALAWRERDLQAAYLPFLKGEGMGMFLTDPVFRQGLDRPPEQDIQPAVKGWMTGFSDLSHTWDDLSFLRDCTSLPIVLKGILHPADAEKAAERDLDGIIVSNHGGRQVDGAIASLDALPPIVNAVGGRMTILFDSGIRRGADILKALALGARAVLVGRPYMWGLAVGGEDGVCEVLQRLFADLDLTLAMSGCPDVRALDASALVHTP